MGDQIFSANLYERLGLPQTASDEEIKAKYRRLALRFHPDKNIGDAEAAEKFRNLAEAYEILSDKDKRARYDRAGAGGGHSEPSSSSWASFTGASRSNPRDVFTNAWSSFFGELAQRVPPEHYWLAMAGAVAGGVFATLTGGSLRQIALAATAAPATIVAMNMNTIAASFGALTPEERIVMLEDIRVVMDLLTTQSNRPVRY
ncbi:DNA-J chaperone, putative [Bodo saltans]|uniref:DNA-J chaperone, putative n=1 Tax=Bodo saltans TaxID=75058 RepID=A0A0S4JZ75_BODSA|nr:DNA-J chaperone, putative [Bodo saltans]|eukprot:CUG94436.1 DNA-J chaperone, putative [Bodo saltans]